jgi:hypothetical protein
MSTVECTVGAKSMARAKSMAPDHTANDIMQIKQNFSKNFLIKNNDGAFREQDLEKKFEFLLKKY